MGLFLLMLYPRVLPLAKTLARFHLIGCQKVFSADARFMPVLLNLNQDSLL